MTTAPTPDSEILLHAAEDGATRVDVRLEGETVWLTQAQLVELFQSSKQNISEHIQNIFEEGELDTEATVRKFRTVRSEGSRDAARQLTHYNLDVIISVGYRVKSATATKFRIWATDRSRDEHACQRRNLIQRPAMRCLQGSLNGGKPLIWCGSRGATKHRMPLIHESWGRLKPPRFSRPQGVRRRLQAYRAGSASSRYCAEGPPAKWSGNAG